MKEDSSYEKMKAAFTEFLVQHHHRKTPERYAILEHICRCEGHFNADSLHRELQDTACRVSRATVYNTLVLLEESHLIIKHRFAGQEAQYEKALDDRIHHHLVCTDCGRVKEFSDKHIRAMVQAKRFAYFEPTHYSLSVYGLCSRCKQKRK